MELSAPVTQLLLAWSQGDRAALDELTPLVYRELHALAHAYLGRGRNEMLQPTALINEVYLRLIGQAAPIRWENRAHFFGIAARLMRVTLVDYSRQRQAAKHGGGAEAVTLHDTVAIASSRLPQV